MKASRGARVGSPTRFRIGSYSARPVRGPGGAEVAQSGTARVWKARGGIRLGSSNADVGRTDVVGILPLGALPPAVTSR